MKNFLLAALFSLAAGAASALEVELKADPQGEPIPAATWKLIEASRDLWAEKLGFDRSYPGVKVTVQLRMFKAESDSAAAFMWTNHLANDFPGSRTLKPGATSTIFFKDRAYRRAGPGRNADSPWFIDPVPRMNIHWPASPTCSVFVRPCKASSGIPAFLDFYSHMVHEFGHVFGFPSEGMIGNFPQAGSAGASGATEFEGLDLKGNPIRFRMGDWAHGVTSNMVIGFSERERGLPNAQEVESMRYTYSYAGVRMLKAGALQVPPRSGGTAGMAHAEIWEDSAYAVGSVEVNAWYASGGNPCGDLEVVLENPQGEKVKLGGLRNGWAKAGRVRPDLLGPQATFRPTDSALFAGLKGKPSKGSWTIHYENKGTVPCAVPAAALRLTDADFVPVTSGIRNHRGYSSEGAAGRDGRPGLSLRLLPPGIAGEAFGFEVMRPGQASDLRGRSLR